MLFAKTSYKSLHSLSCFFSLFTTTTRNSSCFTNVQSNLLQPRWPSHYLSRWHKFEVFCLYNMSSQFPNFSPLPLKGSTLNNSWSLSQFLSLFSGNGLSFGLFGRKTVSLGLKKRCFCNFLPETTKKIHLELILNWHNISTLLK